MTKKKEIKINNQLSGEKDSFSYILAPKGLKVFGKVQTINQKNK